MAHDRAMKSLIVAPAWVGDMVMAHSLIQELSVRPASDAIDILAPASTSSLGSRMSEVRDTYTLDVGHGRLGISERLQMARQLRAQEYDEAYILPNSWKSALIPFFAGIKRRVGWLGEMRFGLLNDARSLDKLALPLMVERFAALSAPKEEERFTRPAPNPSLVFDTENRLRLATKYGLVHTGAIALAPGAEFGPAKKWPISYFSEVARYCVSKGRQIWLLGSAKDSADCAVIAREVEGVIDLSGKTSLVDVVDLISLAEFLVCNDSGLMHVSAALGTKTIAMFGSTTDEFTPPLSSNSQILAKSLDCRPCFKRTCPLGHLDCLNKIAPQEVISVLDL